MPQQFILGDMLTDDQIGELVDHGTVDVGGFLFAEWRRDSEGQTWLKRVTGEIHGITPSDGDVYADGFIDAVVDDDDDDNPIEQTMFFDGYSDDE